MGLKKVLFAGAIVIALAGTGCAVDKNSGGSSNTINIVCSPIEELCNAQAKAFEKETGIKANFVRVSAGETVARLSATKNNPEFDVWYGGPVDSYAAAAKAGLLEKYTSPASKNYDKKYVDSNGYWAGVYAGALGFCSNKKELEKLGLPVPTSWDELLDPKLKGKIAMAHPATSGTAFTALWTQVVLRGSEDAAMEYMKKLNNNILNYTKSGTSPGSMAGRGEIAVGIIFSHDCTLYNEQGMKDLETSFPKEGTGYEVGGVAVVKGAKNPEGAKKFMDWVLSAKSQEIGPTVRSYQLHTAPDAKTDEHMIPLDKVKLVDYDFDKAGAAREGLTKRFDAEVASKAKVVNTK